MSLSVSQLVSGIKAMPEPTKRKLSAIIGAVVADAASLPLQWIYDDKVSREYINVANNIMLLCLENEGDSWRQRS